MMGLSKILIVEDNPDDVFVYKRYIKKSVSVDEIVHFIFAKEGLDYLKDNQVDCILLDYQLPDMSGVDFINKLNQSGLEEMPPVVMLTGSGNENVAVEALKSGASDYIVKGEVNVESLYRAINNATEKARLQKQVKMQEAELRERAYNDFLTGIPNRERFQELAEQSLARSARHKSSLAILMIDLDGFKQVNDTFGHDIGDELLRQVTSLFQNIIRKNDTIGRLGGDEFAIVSENVDVNNIQALAGKLIKQAESISNINGRDVSISCSIGISFYPKDDDSLLKLIKKADLASYQAKHNGRGRYEVFVD
jgi:diguanylate cyclase (GGDEF)-like protein